MSYRKCKFLFPVITVALFLATGGSFVSSQSGGTTARVSVSSEGTQSDGGSYWASISADGRYIAFLSWASNLVIGDVNNYQDIFVHDWQTGDTVLVSVASNGAQANSNSFHPSISADGVFIAFESAATNLVITDTNGHIDIFVNDRLTGTTTRVSVPNSDTEANNESYYPAISGDGRYVAYQSWANNLVENDTNSSPDVFVSDRDGTTTTRVSIASDGTEGNWGGYMPAISADGRFVAFPSNSTNLVDNDTNSTTDIFVHDRQTGITSRVSVASDGTQANDASSYVSISPDGRYVAFHSSASNLVIGDTNTYEDIFVHDRQTGITIRASVASDGTEAINGAVDPSISTNGIFVAFESGSPNLVSNDTNGVRDIFVHNLQTGVTTRISLASGGTQGNFPSYRSSISAQGDFIAFESEANNLVSSDTNDFSDIFVYHLTGFRLFLPVISR